jgi:hypothetical protein
VRDLIVTAREPMLTDGPLDAREIHLGLDAALARHGRDRYGLRRPGGARVRGQEQGGDGDDSRAEAS